MVHSVPHKEMTLIISTIMEISIFRSSFVIGITPHCQIFPWHMIFSKNILAIEKNRKISIHLLILPYRKISFLGGWSGKNLTMWGDLYDPWDAKNQGFHNGRNFEGYFLVGHTVSKVLQQFSKLNSSPSGFSTRSALAQR